MFCKHIVCVCVCLCWRCQLSAFHGKDWLCGLMKVSVSVNIVQKWANIDFSQYFPYFAFVRDKNNRLLHRCCCRRRCSLAQSKQHGTSMLCNAHIHRERHRIFWKLVVLVVDSHKFHAIIRNYGRETNWCAYINLLSFAGNCFVFLCLLVRWTLNAKWTFLVFFLPCLVLFLCFSLPLVHLVRSLVSLRFGLPMS